MSIEDGGPAFPVQDVSKWQAHGMTLRDYFAVKAMAAHIQAAWSNPAPSQRSFKAWADDMPPGADRPNFQDWICFMAENQADAMLAAREATP